MCRSMDISLLDGPWPMRSTAGSWEGAQDVECGRQTRMEWMSIAEIVSEIDSYLSLLRMARDLLSAPVTEARPKRSRRRYKGVELSGKDSPSHSKTRTRKLKSRPTRRELEPNANRRGLKPVVRLSRAVHPKTAADEEVPASAAAEIAPQAAGEVLLPPPSSAAPVQHVRRRKEIIRKEPSVTEPAIALGGAPKDRVVVVPAEEVRRQREEAVRPPVLRQRVSTYGGRTAFEALFKDEPKSPNTR